MIAEIRPDLIYPSSRLFLDYVAARETATELFSLAPDGFNEAARRTQSSGRSRAALADALLEANRRLEASERSIENIEALREDSTLCVMGGQQAGFLGGPLYTLYKILSIVRLASSLAERLGRPVVPIFWLATEDHDFTEINRAVFLERDGGLRRLTFDWEGRGRPIEQLPITPEVLAVLEEALSRFPQESPHRAILQPGDGDDYSTWHARIWSRLFAKDGLILVEPRTIRPLAGSFFRNALTRQADVSAALDHGASHVRTAGYEPLLDPASSGRLFRFDDEGRRTRINRAEGRTDEAAEHAERFSTDVALRPLLVDSIFPTIARLLGPSEIAYHALLRPLYEMLEVPQPVAVPRSGYTLLAEAEAELLERLGLSAQEALAETFDPSTAIARMGSPELAASFDRTKTDVEAALRQLLPALTELDPNLEGRWRQTVDHAYKGIDRLQDRARRADLSRNGIATQQVQRLKASLRPSGRPQERVLSVAHAISRFGVEWIHRLPGSECPDRFTHTAVTIRGGS